MNSMKLYLIHLYKVPFPRPIHSGYLQFFLLIFDFQCLKFNLSMGGLCVVCVFVCLVLLFNSHVSESIFVVNFEK